MVVLKIERTSLIMLMTVLPTLPILLLPDSLNDFPFLLTERVRGGARLFPNIVSSMQHFL